MTDGVGMPSITPGMNKVAPAGIGGGKGAKDEDKDLRLGSDSEDVKEILERARKRMDRAIQAEGDNRKAALDDFKFYKGDQWPADIMAQRNFDQRPCHTINKLPTFVNQVTNDVRQNRPDINISPVGDKSDPEVAKMLAGVVREIERKSAADIAYDTAFACAARGGWGWFRILSEFEKTDSLNQVLSIKRIANPFTVYADPAAQEPDASDMKWCFVSDMLPRDEFKEDYPDADAMPWPQGGIGDSLKTWITKDEIRIAEYFEFENEKRWYVMLENGVEGWEDEIKQDIRDKYETIAERESDCSSLHWYKLTAVEVLEHVKLPIKWIPLVRIIGDEINIEGKFTWSGIVRNAKDAQRAYNYWTTSFTEAVALAPKAPWVLAEGQDEGYEQEFKNANVRPMAVVHYKPVDLNGQLAPPPQRMQQGAVPTGIQQGLQNATQDLMTTTGVRFDMTTKDHVYDESGRALRELRRFGDIGSFHLVDNLARALRHAGEILINWIPKVYDRKRIITILRENDEEERVIIDPNAPQAMGETRDAQNKVLKIFNPTYGEYGVTVTIGPSYATKRIEAAESMMDFLRAIGPVFPQAVTAVADLIAKNQDWPGSDEFTRRLTKVVAAMHPGILQPDMKNVPPDVQAMLGALVRQVQKGAQDQAAMLKVLNDRSQEFALKARDQDLNFEAKLLAVAQKAEAAEETNGAKLNLLMDAVLKMKKLLDPDEGGNSSSPALAA